MVIAPGNTKNGARFRRILRMDFEQLAAEYSNMIYSIIHSLRIYKNHDEFYRFPTEDSHFKECEGRSPMSKWEMNVGWR